MPLLWIVMFLRICIDYLLPLMIKIVDGQNGASTLGDRVGQIEVQEAKQLRIEHTVLSGGLTRGGGYAAFQFACRLIFSSDTLEKKCHTTSTSFPTILFTSVQTSVNSLHLTTFPPLN